MNDANPFAALESLRDSLPAGEDAPAAAPEKAREFRAADFKIFYERKGRGGKEVTIIECPAAMTDEQVAALAKRLRNALGTCGSVSGCEILLQGDRRAALPALLK